MADGSKIPPTSSDPTANAEAVANPEANAAAAVTSIDDTDIVVDPDVITDIDNSPSAIVGETLNDLGNNISIRNQRSAPGLGSTYAALQSECAEFLGGGVSWLKGAFSINRAKLNKRCRHFLEVVGLVDRGAWRAASRKHCAVRWNVESYDGEEVPAKACAHDFLLDLADEHARRMEVARLEAKKSR